MHIPDVTLKSGHLSLKQSNLNAKFPNLRHCVLNVSWWLEFVDPVIVLAYSFGESLNLKVYCLDFSVLVGISRKCSHCASWPIDSKFGVQLHCFCLDLVAGLKAV